jgi:hypothetical protein
MTLPRFERPVTAPVYLRSPPQLWPGSPARLSDPARTAVLIEVVSKPLAAARVLQKRGLLIPGRSFWLPGATIFADYNRICNAGEDPGRAVFIGPPQALRILTSIPRRPH